MPFPMLPSSALKVPAPSGSSGPPVSGYAAWWDPSQITGVADGAALTEFPDLSGNGNNWVQNTTVDKPTFYKSTSGKLINGLPAVWFSGAQFMQNTGPIYSNGNTYFLVGSGFTGSSEYVTGSSNAYGSGPAFIFGFTSGELQYYSQLASGDTADEQTFGTPGGNAWVAAWAQTDGSVLQGYYNSSGQVFSVTPHNAANGLTNEFLGAAQGSSNFANGGIGEGIIYTSVLSPTQIASVMAYLTAKWL